MENQQLRDYIKQQLERGLSKEDVKNILVSNGRPAADVDAILNSLDPISTGAPVVSVSPLAATSILSIPSTSTTPFISNVPNTPAAKHGGNKTLLVGILSAAGLLLIAGSVLAYPYFFPSPDKVVRNMFTELPAVRALEYKGEIKTEITGFSGTIPGFSEQPTPQNGTVTVSFDGATDFIDLNNVKNRAVIGIKADSSVSVVQVAFNLGLEIRNIGPTIYIKLSDIPPIGPFDLSFLSDQWIEIDVTPYKEQIVGSFNEGFQSQMSEDYQKPTPEQIEEIGTIFAEAQILDVTEKLSGENINGISTHHYKFTVNKENIRKAFIAIYASQGKEPDEQWLADTGASLEKMGAIDGEIWIGKSDELPYKVIFSFATEKTADVEFATKSTITFTFNNYNKPIQVDVPPETKTIEEVIGMLLMGGSGGSSDELLEQGRDSQRLSDMARLNSVLAFYSTDVIGGLSCAGNKVYSSLEGTTAVDGTGWLPVNFTKISVGSPLKELPIDPTNDASAHYTYACNQPTQTYELNAVLKSTKYSAQMANDGGNNPNIYETGNDPGLDILTGDIAPAGGNSGTSGSRDAKRIGDLNSIQNYVEAYFSKCGTYPIVSISSSGCGGTLLNNWSQFSEQLNTAVGVTVPSDPSPGRSFWYGWEKTGRSYVLGVNLEADNQFLNETGELDSISGFFTTSADVNCSDTSPTFGYCIGGPY